MIEQSFLEKIKSILKSKKGLFVFGVAVVIFSLLAGIFLASDQQKKQQVADLKNKVEESQQGKPNTIVKNELIVEFKDEYSPEKLKEQYQTAQKGKGFFGFLKDESETEKRYKAQMALFDKLGIVNYEKLTSLSDTSNTYILRFEKISVMVVREEIEKSGMAESTSLNIYMEFSKLPNDSYITQQKPAIDAVKLPDAWDIATGSENIQVAVIDSGIDSDHPDLRGAVIAVSDADVGAYKLKPSSQDTRGHGSHVAGIIGALGNNGTGIAGVNWKVKMVAVNVTGDKKSSDIIRGMYYAMDNKIKIINLSMGADLDKITDDAKKAEIIGSDEQVTCSDFPSFFRNIERFNALGGVVVVAAGNENKDASRSFPSCNADKILNVAAINSQDVRGGCERNQCFSNYGNTVHLAAPGVRVLSTKSTKCNDCDRYSQEDGGYMYNSGTSMAAPFVSGAAALLLSVNPNLNSEQIRKCLVDYADSFTPKDGKPIGKRLNVAKSLNGCKNIQGGAKAASSADEGYPRLGIIDIGPRCVVAGEKVNVRVRGEAKSDDFPIIMVNAFYRRMGQDINGKDKTGQSWTRFFEDRNVGDKRIYIKEGVSFDAPPVDAADEANKFSSYDVVINVHTHKALSRGGGAFAEKFCSGNPFQSELDFAKAADCGSGGRQVLSVVKEVSMCPAEMRAGLQSLSDPSLRTQDISPSGGTSGNPVPDKDYTCEYKPTVNSDGTLNLTSLECKPK